MTYDAPTVTGAGLWSGTKLLRTRLQAVFPELNVQGGYNPRCVQFHPTRVGQARCEFGHRISHHAECRAIDVMTSDRATQERIVAWALGPEGQAYGVQEIIRGWGPGGLPSRWVVGVGWKLYTGPSAHRDHVHLSQTIEAAARTSPPLIDPPKPPDPPEDDDMATTVARVVPCGDNGKGWAPLGVSPDKVIGGPWCVLGYPFREALPEVRLFATQDGEAAVHVSSWFPGAAIEVRCRVA